MANITASNLEFLKLITENNNREWFLENKAKYETEKENVIEVAQEILANLSKHDHIETISGKKSLYRIYRDVRFSKDKTPYKNHWSGSFKRATKQLRGGYYFHIEKDKNFIGGGFWGPSPADLKKIRLNIIEFESEYRDIIDSKSFKKFFGKLEGDQLKTAPKGFDKEHKAIDLLRYKQFLLGRSFTDKEVLSPNFVKEVDATFKAMRPYFDFMSEALTTDENGQPLL